MLSRLDHPNLVRVEPVIEINGRSALVMEYVRGATGEQIVRARPNGIPVADALAMIRDAARGLDAAWTTTTGSLNTPMHIVHRDIKPGNLMLTLEGRLKVVDFGMAKASLDDRESQSAAFVPGSRGYMAPERYDGEDTPKGDVYALGLTLFELIAGKKPVVSLRHNRHDEDIARTVQLLPLPGLSDEAAKELRALLLDMCAYEADQRPWPVAVAGRVDALLTRHDLTPDLPRFAADVVKPLFDARPRVPPWEHPRYPEVSFLEREITDPGGRTSNIAAEVRRAVKSADFPERAKQLAALLASNPETDVRPLLDVLDGASAPSWQFWRKPPTVARTLAALEALRSVRRGSVRSRAQRLTQHRDPMIAAAARTMLDRG